MDRKGYDWVYAPKPSVGVGGGVERVADVVWKVVGKDAAAQCAYSVRVVNGYTVEAFLPRSDAEGKKIAGHGYFLSIDARPVSAARGTMKLIAKAFREKLKKSNPALEDVKDPFIRMGIGCPPGSYDPNVEPSKDDLLFDDAGAVVAAVKDFLEAFYSSSLPAIEQSSDTTEVSNTGPQVEDDDDDEMTADGDIFDQLMDVSSVNLVEAVAAQQNQTQEVTALSSVMSDLNAGRSQVHEEQQTEYDGSPQPKRQRTWKYNMYDIDEDDFAMGDAELDNAPDNEPAENAADQQDLNDITLSNPWTMAKMNSKVRNPEPTNKAQQEQAPSQLIGFRRNLQTKPPSEPRNTQAKSHLLTPQPSSPFRESNSLEGRTIDPRALNMFHSRDIPTVTEASEQANGVHLLSPSNSVQLNSDDGFFPVSTKLSQQGMSNHAVTGGARARLGRGRRHISGIDGVNKAFKSPVNLDIRYWMAGTNRRTRESSTKNDAVVSKGSSSIAHNRSTAHHSNNGEAPAIELLRKIEKSLQALDRMTNGLSLTRSGDDMQCFFGSEWVEVMSSTVVQKWADRLGELLTQNAPAGFEKAKLREDLSFVVMEAVEKQRSGVSVGV
ncbi:DNA mismatch repair protein [Macrophomina phaseolina MS6]|uniref:DNA mismatch repair protein n=1 Tax=Macrophomina phaseolina (strain MS6) TaxID=1126212 RepID=K2RHP2_MACPH|nr:DNA mismatch repair protein [Macrophomina phaseolina MS6]